jgi:hypothetical protein
MALRPDTSGRTTRRRTTTEYRFSNWDRRSGFDRRRGPRRLRLQPALPERRRHEDRRLFDRQRRLGSGANRPQPIGRYRFIASILTPGLLRARSPVARPRFRVLARRAGEILIYSAWEEAEPAPDGAEYTILGGHPFRRIGTTIQTVEELANVESAADVYRDEFRRAYDTIFSLHPEIADRGERVDGEVRVPAVHPAPTTPQTD